MKIPLHYQITRYNCGTESLLNAVSYLYDREDTPVELLKTIYTYSVDDYGRDGLLGDGGTSAEAMAHIAHHFNNYAKDTGFGIDVKFFTGRDVDENLCQKHLKPQTVAVVRVVFQQTGHYVMISKIDGDDVYMFDPWYSNSEEYDNDAQVQAIDDQPLEYNRIVKTSRFFSHNVGDFALGKVEKREALFVVRTKN
jgi:predicted double-glycine peptidase